MKRHIFWSFVFFSFGVLMFLFGFFIEPNNSPLFFIAAGVGAALFAIVAPGVVQ